MIWSQLGIDLDTENNSFLCTICGSSFRERWELQSHNQKSHDTRVFKCATCEKEVVGQRKMEGHKQSHKKKSCNICWIQIPINSFSNHRAKCEGIMLHCDLCEYETPKKQFLQKHVSSIHKAKPPQVKETKALPCPYYKKMFTPIFIWKETMVELSISRKAISPFP